MRAQKERLADGHPGVPRAIRQGMRDPPSQYFSTAEGLEAVDDCRLGTSESCRKTAGGSLRILFDSVENGGVFHCVGASRRRFAFEDRVSFCEASKPAVDGDDGSGVLPNALLMLRTAAVAPVPRRHS